MDSYSQSTGDGAADAVEDHIDRTDGAVYLVGPVVVAIVDREVGAVGAGEVQCGHRSRRGHDGCGAGELGQLNRKVTDGPGGGMDQDCLAGRRARQRASNVVPIRRIGVAASSGSPQRAIGRYARWITWSVKPTRHCWSH